MQLDSFHSHTESAHAAIARDFPSILYLDEDTTGSWSQITSTTRRDEPYGRAAWTGIKPRANSAPGRTLNPVSGLGLQGRSGIAQGNQLKGVGNFQFCVSPLGI